MLILLFPFVSFTDSLFQSANVDVALDATVNHANVKTVVHANAIANRVIVCTDRAVSLILTVFFGFLQMPILAVVHHARAKTAAALDASATCERLVICFIFPVLAKHYQ